MNWLKLYISKGQKKYDEKLRTEKLDMEEKRKEEKRLKLKKVDLYKRLKSHADSSAIQELVSVLEKNQFLVIRPDKLCDCELYPVNIKAKDVVDLLIHQENRWVSSNLNECLTFAKGYMWTITTGKKAAAEEGAVAYLFLTLDRRESPIYAVGGLKTRIVERKMGKIDYMDLDNTQFYKNFDVVKKALGKVITDYVGEYGL